MSPFLEGLHAARSVLIAGCGGGFDVYSGVPIGVYLMRRECSVVFANYSFSQPAFGGCERIAPNAWRVEASARETPYFPEKWLAEWLAQRSLPAPVYALTRTGAQPLLAAYKALLDRHPTDLVILVDGGTDSLIFGDEPGLGTVAEDAVSLVAACGAAGAGRTLLAVIGFGIDHFHGVSHYAFLENVARLSRSGGYLGGIPLVQGMPEADAFLELVDHANQRQPHDRSIVCNSIASALRGEFGDYHATDHTGGTELFINPLMTQYWAFEADRVLEHMGFAGALAQTLTIREAVAVIEEARESLVIRPRRSLPL